jgi:hypothetical protein
MSLHPRTTENQGDTNCKKIASKNFYLLNQEKLFKTTFLKK